MKIKPILMLTAIIVSILLVACAAPGQKAWVEVSSDEFNGNHHVSQALEVQMKNLVTIEQTSA